MQITDQQEGPILVIELDGRLDHAGAELFREHALKLIEDGARSIVVDFNNTSFVASMGIRALIFPAQEMSKNGGRFALTGFSPSVRQLFEVAGLMTMFKVYPSLAEAAADGIWV
ncbi:hypothetical protein BH09VER1_BH09VER1_05790 [soil metagenome]